MDCELREIDRRSHGESNTSFSLERAGSSRLECTSGDFKTFLVRIIVLANSDNVIDSTHHNR
jgi:hypothetical protein